LEQTKYIDIKQNISLLLIFGLKLICSGNVLRGKRRERGNMPAMAMLLTYDRETNF
jgi:hypothetical protein